MPVGVAWGVNDFKVICCPWELPGLLSFQLDLALAAVDKESITLRHCHISTTTSMIGQGVRVCFLHQNSTWTAQLLAPM